MHRWTARLLLLVMLAPAFAPAAMARAAQPEAMHCQRKPAMPVMHCHHGMAMVTVQEPLGTSIRSLDCCCPNHDCCRGAKTSVWARPGSIHISCLSLLIEHAPVSWASVLPCLDLFANDSARAPPRS